MLNYAFLGIARRRSDLVSAFSKAQYGIAVQSLESIKQKTWKKTLAMAPAAG